MKMLALAIHKPRDKKLAFLSSFHYYVSSKLLLKPTTSTVTPVFPSLHSPNKPYHSLKGLLPVRGSSKPTYKINLSLLTKINGFSFSPLAARVYGLDSEVLKSKLKIFSLKLAEIGIELRHFAPGQYNGLLCPMCKGGRSKEKSFSLLISVESGNAAWICHRAKCGWKGRIKVTDSCLSHMKHETESFAGTKSSYGTPFELSEVRQIREITEQSLELEPLCHELVDYFKERLISAETLVRNHVMQRSYYHGQVAIAFTYWRNGVLVSCKYRDINKKFWQEKDTEKIFYGLDDIKGADEIIIVEGEMDKLSMEEAGFHNCVSVPDGAPASVSSKVLPSQLEDRKYRYLWNSKEYLDKASCIILATDGDPPGQALAEELARRLGKERCWRVNWPKKNKDEHFKDANEVLMFLGPDALNKVIGNAQKY